MPHTITDYQHEWECVIARLNMEIGHAVSAAVARPEGLTAVEAVIALTLQAQAWAREQHKQDVAESDPANARPHGGREKGTA